jgi:CheY-like chemotaxis protein
MSATYKFVKSMNGDIQVDSAVGKGTTMTVLLPIHVDAAGGEAPAKAAEAKAAAGDADTTKRKGGTILLVDDDKSIRDSISAFLRNTGYSVFTASDGQDAVEKYVNTHEGIDLVIMDMVMPRMGGKEAFVKMKDINADVKAIGITGFTTHSVEEMTGVGMKRILHKPFSFDELSSVVAEYI